MSFFFTKAKAETKAPQAPKAATKDAKEILNRLGCKGCPLNKVKNKTPKMEPDLASHTEVYILGDQPSAYDDVKGYPFEDEAGRILRGLVGGRLSTTSLDNVIRDWDPSGAGPSWVPAESCRLHIVKSIEETKPKVVVGLGITALQWGLNSTDMIGLRGRIFAAKFGNHACYFLPTYHPRDLIENAFNPQKPLQSKLGSCLKFDLNKAYEAAKWSPPEIDTPQGVRAGLQAFSGNSPDHLAQVLKLIGEAAKAPEKAIDLETYPIRPYAADAKLLTFAISFGKTNFSFAYNHPKAGWKPNEKKQLKSAIRELLSTPAKLIAHNTPFEVEWLIANFGKEYIYQDDWECTMMQSHFLDERRGKRGGNDEQFQPNPYQALDFLVKQYFGISYKPLFKLDKKRMDLADLDETLVYNAADTKYTLKLYKLQKALLKQAGLFKAYKEAQPRQAVVALMQSIGIDLDQTVNKKFAKKLGAEISAIEAEMNKHPEVQKYIKDHKSFNPASGPEVIKLFKDYLKVGKALINAEGKEATDKSVLSKISHPFAGQLDNFRNRSKLKSTYVDCFTLGKGEFIWPDGKLHPSFNTTFSETGRTSCAAAWTPILTDTGVKQLKDVCLNDLVFTHRHRWKKVVSLWRKGTQPMFNVHLSNGSILTCTKNHRVLGTDDSWQSIGTLYDLFQKVGKQSSQRTRSVNSVPFKEFALSAEDCNTVTDDTIKCLVGDQESFESARIQDLENVKVFGLKNGKQKPNERVGWGNVPTLERHLQRQKGILYDQSRHEKDICSPRRANESPELACNSRGLGSSPHRRKPSKQQSGQPSPCDQKRAHSYPLKDASGQQIISIEEITPCGSSEVFDITVEEDSSYASCGIFSHNSDEPNQQNWPSRSDKWVRRQVVALPGHVLVAFDFGQLEACTAAMCTRDKTLVKALWEDYDIHMEWSIKAAHRYPAFIGGLDNLKDKDVMKKFRSLIKNKLVFPVFFGARNESVAGYLNAPIEPINKLMDEFWRTFFGVHGWQKRIMNDYYDLGYVESPTGRRRHYPLSKNQAVNYPIQSVACDIVCRAMVRLSNVASETGKWYLHPIMNIHDDLTFCIPDDDKILEEAIETIYKTMLTPPYDFVNVPLSVSGSIGQNWLDMDEIGKFWSHKDL